VLKRANEILLKLEATSVRESPVVKEEPSASDNVTSPTKSPQTSSAPPRISKARQKKENSRQVLQELDLFYDLDK
jgi:hypothetical protein